MFFLALQQLIFYRKKYSLSTLFLNLPKICEVCYSSKILQYLRAIDNRPYGLLQYLWAVGKSPWF